MVRLLTATVAALLLGACASAPTSRPGDLILGKWTCSAAREGMNVVGDVTYAKDGTAVGDAKLAIKAGGTDIALTADVDSAWRILPDGKLEETIRSAKVKTANTGGADAPPAVVESMIQPVVDQMIVGQTATSTVVFDGQTMTQVDDKGDKTVCKR
jgi:hypothetical protein